MRANKIIALMFCVLFSLGVLASGWARDSASKKKPTKAEIAAGKRLFERHCAVCHGIDGKGGRGPALNRVLLSRAPDDTALKRVISDGIPPIMPEGYFLDDKEIANLAAFVRSLGKIPAEPVRGNVGRGGTVYAKGGCSGCHIKDGEGAGYGPDLTAIGDRHSASFVQKAVSKPASLLPEDFLLVRVTTASGETIEGIRANEDSFTIQIKDASGRYHSLRKQELKELRKLRGETPMPSFDGILSATEIEDLVAYLISPRVKQ